ncbi:hypothetical protein FB451DRAFT_1179932 [Mycena latifolia]|nr:hypothetical protein FB451DRAFT_1179932 [Mycena latifolia]
MRENPDENLVPGVSAEDFGTWFMEQQTSPNAPFLYLKTILSVLLSQDVPSRNQSTTIPDLGLAVSLTQFICASVNIGLLPASAKEPYEDDGCKAAHDRSMRSLVHEWCRTIVKPGDSIEMWIRKVLGMNDFRFPTPQFPPS